MGKLVKSAVLALSALTSGCFVGDVFPQGKGVPAPPAPPPPAPAPADPTPSRLGGGPLARRLALDFGPGLPLQIDVTALTADATKFPAAADAVLTQGGLGRALAGLHGRMWHLDSRELPDLDAIAATDPSLASALTPAVRQEIVDEPSELVRWTIDQALPFSLVFTAGFAVTTPDLATLWGLGDGGAAFPGEPLRYGDYHDGRPATGLFGTNGLAAAIPGRADPVPRSRAARLLTEFLCQPLEVSVVHGFGDLSATELSQDLATLAVTRSPCDTCHAYIEAPATAFAGLNDGAALSAWTTYAAPGTTPTGSYAGRPFTGLGAMAALVGADPRAHRCEVKKLLEAIYQRPFGDIDGDTLDQALDEFYRQNMSLPAATRIIAMSSEYGNDVIGPKLKGKYLAESSGVRVLGRTQWRGVIADLAPAATGLVLTDDLDPGHDEGYDAVFAVPSGAYWHAVDRLARQLASAIVATELADGVPAAARRVLTDLPDGAAAGASATVVDQQIKDLWTHLTGAILADSDSTYQSFLTLWSAALAGGSAEQSREAWRTMLVGMLSHPAFLTY